MLIWSETALADVVQLRRFLTKNNPDAASRAAQVLTKGTAMLLKHPSLGCRREDRTDRELIIPFGKRGYVLRYRQEGTDIVILKIWHSLEKRTKDL